MRMPKDQISAFRPARSWRNTSGAAHNGENCPCAVLRLPCTHILLSNQSSAMGAAACRTLAAMHCLKRHSGVLPCTASGHRDHSLLLPQEGRLKVRAWTPCRPRSAILAAPKVDSSTLGLLHKVMQPVRLGRVRASCMVSQPFATASRRLLSSSEAMQDGRRT